MTTTATSAPRPGAATGGPAAGIPARTAGGSTAAAAPGTPAAPGPRTSGAFHTEAARRRYWTIAGVLLVLALLLAAGLVGWAIPVEFGTDGYWLIAQRRVFSVVVMLIVGVSQAVATVAFQTVTNNRIITPSIMGFESLYRVIQTTSVYLFGLGGLVAFTGPGAFAFQVAVMMGLAVALYGWLLTGKHANLQVMLLIGIIIGSGLGSVASFMQRLLTPSEFDVLTARMFGSVNNADASYLPLAVPIVVIAAGALWMLSKTLNVIALGRDTASNLGVNHQRTLIGVLVLCAALISVSTALVGPMTFLGFLVATLSYQFAGTHDHRYVFPMAALTGFVVLAGAYFLLNNVLRAAGAVSVIIEFIGGGLFLYVILRKGRL